MLSMAGLRGCQELRRTERYDYIGLLREAAEIVALNPLLSAPIRAVSDIVVVQTVSLAKQTFFARATRTSTLARCSLIWKGWEPGFWTMLR
jgi:hypothetical protein